MNISLCTITFRHHLISLEQIADWASRNGFQGIEIWGAHTRHIPYANGYDARWLAGFGLHVPMVSDYLPLHQPDDLQSKTAAALDQARRWGTFNIRTFAGPAASADTPEPERATITQALRFACERVADQGRYLLIETHPGTLADTLASTVRLLDEVDHPALAVNFDALHVWEGGMIPAPRGACCVPGSETIISRTSPRDLPCPYLRLTTSMMRPVRATASYRCLRAKWTMAPSSATLPKKRMHPSLWNGSAAMCSTR